MASSHKKPGVAFWATVVVVAGLLYVASLGPMCWLCGNWAEDNTFMVKVVPNTYYPILWLARIARREVAPGQFQESWLDHCIEWCSTLDLDEISETGT